MSLTLGNGLVNRTRPGTSPPWCGVASSFLRRSFLPIVATGSLLGGQWNSIQPLHETKLKPEVSVYQQSALSAQSLAQRNTLYSEKSLSTTIRNSFVTMFFQYTNDTQYKNWLPKPIHAFYGNVMEESKGNR